MISAMTLIFHFLDGDVPRSTSYGIYISQLIRFARVSSHVADFNARNKSLTPNFSNRAIGIINFERHSPNFIADTMNWFLNSMLDLKHLCIKAYRNRNFMVT